MKTLADVRVVNLSPTVPHSGDFIDLGALAGSPVARVEGFVSHVDGYPVFVVCRLVFADGRVAYMEGAHDAAFIPAGSGVLDEEQLRELMSDDDGVRRD